MSNKGKRRCEFEIGRGTQSSSILPACDPFASIGQRVMVVVQRLNLVRTDFEAGRTGVESGWVGHILCTAAFH